MAKARKTFGSTKHIVAVLPYLAPLNDDVVDQMEIEFYLIHLSGDTESQEDRFLDWMIEINREEIGYFLDFSMSNYEKKVERRYFDDNRWHDAPYVEEPKVPEDPVDWTVNMFASPEEKNVQTMPLRGLKCSGRHALLEWC